MIIRDIPFLIVRGYNLAGLPEPVEVHVAYFRTYGTMREQPLAPPSSIEGVMEEFKRQWKLIYGDSYVIQALENIRLQINRFIGK
jgi:hypothetical protein